MGQPILKDNQFSAQVFTNPNPTQQLQTVMAAGYLTNFPDWVTGAITTDGKSPAKDLSNFDISLCTDLCQGVMKNDYNAPYVGTTTSLYAIGKKPQSWYNGDGDPTFRCYAVNYGYTYFNYTGGKFISSDSSSYNALHYTDLAKLYMVANVEHFDDGTYDVDMYLVGDYYTKGVHSYYSVYGVGYDMTVYIKNFFGNPTKPIDDSGTYDDTAIDIELPAIPTIDMCDAGVVNIWQPTLANLHQLSEILWSASFVDTLVKSYSNPVDCIIALNLVPSIANATTGAATNLAMGNYVTDISTTTITTQFFEVDMGTYTFEKYWASALDYDPYTKIQLYLPYIGFSQLSPDDVMGKTINVKYRCDVVTGEIIAFVLVSTATGQTPLYTMTGNFAINVPITGANFGEIYKAIIQGTISATAAIATGGMSALATAGMTANAVTSSKIQYERGSGMSMCAGYLGVQRCYVIISRPQQSLAEDYNLFVGYPSNITAVLNTLKGFTQIEDIHLENVSATDDEKLEIETILKGGIII